MCRRKIDAFCSDGKKLGDYNEGRNGSLLTLLFYMTFLLTEL